ncbi:MAG TPA: type VII secretion protein EccB [Pseudonocardiaceae bacterium]|nr:type VII secretion protein EccB [Pseudonocardiaceae bacterium]
MASKRDQLQAHQFVVQRAVSALVTREGDPEQPPFRRPGGAALTGVVLAVIALAAVGVFGLIDPGGDKTWQDGNSVIVVKETGARFVYLHRQLHQVTNYSSALLALNKAASANLVSANSLVGVPRGVRIGIQDAPDALPSRDHVLTGGWTICSAPTTDPSGTTVYQSMVLVGQQPRGGTELHGEALLVQVPGSGDLYLLSDGHRHLISGANAVTVGLALNPNPVVPVNKAVLDVMPDGAPIAPIPVPNVGAPSQAVPGRTDIRVGQLLVVTSGSGRRYFLAEARTLRPLTALQFDIQRAFQPTSVAYGGGQPAAVPLTPLAASEASLDPVPPVTENDPPSVPPRFPLTGPGFTSVCLTFDSGSFTPRLTIDSALPPASAMTLTTGTAPGGVALADRVLVPPGRIAVVESMPAAAAPAGTLALVTDQGRAYPLASPDLLDVLGYSGVHPVRVPAELMARVPQGPGLSHDAAMRTW